MLTEHNFNKQLRIAAVIRGLILGVILLALNLFSFYFITEIVRQGKLVVAGPYFFDSIFPLIISLLFCLDIRRKVGGYWEFKQAVTGVFIMFLVCYAILAIGRDIVFVKLVEPNMVSKTEAVMLNARYESLKSQGAGQKEISSQMVELRKQLELQKDLSFFDIVYGYLANIILLFVLSLVFASIFKKPPPYIFQVNNDTADANV